MPTNLKEALKKCINSIFSSRGYEILSFLLFLRLIITASYMEEGAYWIFISLIEDKISLAILSNFTILLIYKIMNVLFIFFFERILEGERLEITDRVRIRLIFVSFTLIIFYLSKDEFTFIIYVSTVIILWCIIWITSLRSEFLASKPTKEWNKIIRIFVLYVF